MNLYKSQLNRAFTLVELLVVIAIMAILIGLLLPAVSRVREAARNLQCQNNLKQMGLALQNYHCTYKKFPWGGYMHPNTFVYGTKVDGSRARGFAWSVYILPYMDMQSLYEQIDFNQMYADGPNLPLAQTKIASFICPSATRQEPIEAVVYSSSGKAIRMKKATLGLSHYGGIYGERIAWNGRTLKLPNDPPRGTLLYARQIRVREISDGTTCTLMVGEDTHWEDGQWASSLNVMDQSSYINDPAVTENEIRSDHSGGTGANAVFADGHVQFLSSDMSMEALAAICTRASGEIIPQE